MVAQTGTTMETIGLIGSYEIQGPTNSAAQDLQLSLYA